MTDTRTIPARSMGHDDIMPLIREVHSLRERGHYAEAAELDAAIRQPLTVAGRVLEHVGEDNYRWFHSDIMLTAHADTWRCVLTTHGVDTAIMAQTQGQGATIAAALADARARYEAAISDTLLRMGALLREVVS